MFLPSSGTNQLYNSTLYFNLLRVILANYIILPYQTRRKVLKVVELKMYKVD